MQQESLHAFDLTTVEAEVIMFFRLLSAPAQDSVAQLIAMSLHAEDHPAPGLTRMTVYEADREPVEVWHRRR